MFLRRRFYVLLAIVVIVMAAGYFQPACFTVGQWLLVALVAVTLGDVALLYASRRGMTATRSCNERMSLGDDNPVEINLTSHYSIPVRVDVIDEVPHVAERHGETLHCRLDRNDSAVLHYNLRPLQRGQCDYGRVLAFVRSPLGIAERRCASPEQRIIHVYPSYRRLDHLELMAISNLTLLGSKRVRRIGNNTDFEQIKPYVQGDDYRTINWKATARSAQLMVNVYQQERDQALYCLIDCGRTMHDRYQGLTLVDHAVNASLALAYVAIHRDDRAGLVSFDKEIHTLITPSSRMTHMSSIVEALYNIDASSADSDYETLVLTLNQRITHRALMVLFTNFTSRPSLERQLPYLQQLSRHHRLLVVIYDDPDVQEYLATPATNLREHYGRIVARRDMSERKHLCNLLAQHGIQSIHTTPAQLTVDVLNRYIEVRHGGV